MTFDEADSTLAIGGLEVESAPLTAQSPVLLKV